MKIKLLVILSMVFVLQSCINKDDGKKDQVDIEKENDELINNVINKYHVTPLDSLKWYELFTYQIQEECNKKIRLGMEIRMYPLFNDIIKVDSVYYIYINKEFRDGIQIQIQLTSELVDKINDNEFGYLIFETFKTEIKEMIVAETGSSDIYAYKQNRLVVHTKLIDYIPLKTGFTFSQIRK